jgi:anti-anti-sigma factor
MFEDRVLCAVHDGIHVLRYVGDIRAPLAPAIQRFADALLEREVPQGLVIDLTDARAIDSTNLGVLARIANRMHERGGPRVTIVSCRRDINEVLMTMGFDEVFNIVRDIGAAPPDTQPLPVAEDDRETLLRTVLEAHRALVAMNEQNREVFRDLVAVLEQQEGR